MTIADRVLSAIALQTDGEPPGHGAYLRSDLALDSLDIIMIGQHLEVEFSIEFSNEEMSAAETVGDLIRLAGGETFLMDTVVEFRHFHLACGLGGGAKGFNRGTARVGNLVAKFRCIGGVDVDPAACRDFGIAAGVAATCLDLFNVDQYIAFHGHPPPAGWREATTADYHRAAGGERPHIIFASFPCKGFSGLLSEKASKTAKYQALNGLTFRGLWLALDAWADDPPEFIIFENVPRISTRGRHFLDQIKALLRSFNYLAEETQHDCGEIGGLAQSRKRFLLVARHREKVPNFLYEPTKRALRGVGEVLDRLPLPLSGLGGPMHRMPALQWKTWVRLAFVEAGSDWRSLNKLRVEDGVLADYGISADCDWQGGVLGVSGWDEPTGVVAGRSTPTNGRFSVADPRPENFPKDRGGLLGVGEWNQPAALVTSQRSPQQGRYSVADPRVDGHPKSVQLGVRPWGVPAGVVTGKMFAGGGPNSVADPRIVDRRPYSHVYRIVSWGSSAPSITGANAGTGAAVGDPRPVGGYHGSGKYKVTPFDESAGTVIAASTTGNGGFAVADPRTEAFNGGQGVLAWGESSGAIGGESMPSNGRFAVADPRPSRPPEELHGKHHVTPFDGPARAVIAGRDNGASVVADPRYQWDGAHENKMAVRSWDGQAKTVTGSDRVGSGAQSVADPRPVALSNPDREGYATQGHYGVVPWSEPSGAVPGFSKNNNGKWSVADPRLQSGQSPDANSRLPASNDRLVCVIRAIDGTWHRPFTTLELAALQSLVDPEEFLELDGLSDAAWRERIGNAVPPDAAEAVAGVMGRCLLMAMTGETFSLSAEPIWVQPLVVALSVQPQFIPGET